MVSLGTSVAWVGGSGYLEAACEKRREVLRRTTENDAMNVHGAIAELEREV
jgi:hypothetical protein